MPLLLKERIIIKICDQGKMTNMNFRRAGRFGLLAISFLIAGGCYPNFAGLNAYNSAITPNSTKPYTMDPGSYSGIADATGGQIPGASYGTGAKLGKYDGHSYSGSPGHYARMKAERKLQFGNGPVNWSGKSPIITAP